MFCCSLLMRKMGSGLDIWEKMVLSAWISRVDHGKVMDANRVLTFILYGMACQGPKEHPLWDNVKYDTYMTCCVLKIFLIFFRMFPCPPILDDVWTDAQGTVGQEELTIFEFIISNQQILYNMQFVIQYTMMWYILYIKSSQSQDEILLCLWQVSQHMSKMMASLEKYLCLKWWQV